MSTLFDYIINTILNKKDDNDLQNDLKNGNLLWKTILNYSNYCSRNNCKESIKILILNAPCNGFGDLVFAIKLSKYLSDWYENVEVSIATTYESGLLRLGADPQYVIGLKSGKRTQCRLFQHLKFTKNIPKQDLIFVAPIQMDFKPNINDVKKLIPYANKFNTFTFSEYNDDLDKNFTFNTGIGKNRDGIFLTKVPKNTPMLQTTKNSYALIYVAQSLNNVDKCILSFTEMISKKYYQKIKKLDIVIPKWFEDEDMDDKIKKKISKYYPYIIIKTSSGKEIVISDKDSRNVLTFRCDILPVPNEKMIRLMKNSVDDILLTGDQSITDALSCCYNKNIFYQIAPWKENLGKSLAKELPNKYLKSSKTSCGTLQAINYKSNYKNFIKRWDFRKICRKKMDSIIISSIAIKTDKKLQNLIQLMLKSRTLGGLSNKIRLENKKPSNKKPSSKKPSSKKPSSKKKRKCKHGELKKPVKDLKSGKTRFCKKR
jgi:hypothetical protein